MSRPRILVLVVAVCAVGGPAAFAVVLLAQRAVSRDGASPPPLRVALSRALPVVTVLVTIASLLTISHLALGAGEPPSDGTVPAVNASDRKGLPFSMDWFESNVRAGPGQPQPAPGQVRPDHRPGAVVLMLLVGFLVALIAGVVAWWWRTRSAAEARARDHEIDREREPDGAALHGALMGTIAAMLANPDPKTAIIGAYAQLQEELGGRDAARRPPEGPMEHLRRVLSTGSVRPAPLRRLVELFQLARFSTRPLRAAHRSEAIESLKAVAADLTSSQPPFPAKSP